MNNRTLENMMMHLILVPLSVSMMLTVESKSQSMIDALESSPSLISHRFVLQGTHGAPVVSSNISGSNRTTVGRDDDATDNGPYGWWTNGTLGFGFPGISRGTGFSIQFDDAFLSIRYLLTEESQLLWSNQERESVREIGLLYGRMSKSVLGWASISFGVAVVEGVRRGRILRTGGWFGPTFDEERTFSSVGAPVEGQLFWTPIPQFGIGTCAFGNLNMEQSFLGAAIAVRIGNI